MLVRPLVPDSTVDSVFTCHGLVPGLIGRSGPQVDHQLAVDPGRDSRANFFALHEVLRERVAHSLEAGPHMSRE